jgi:hypothetical protein
MNSNSVSYYHGKAKAIRNAKKTGATNMVNAEAKNTISNLYNNAVAAHNKAGTYNKNNANKLQELLRWSKGYWTYGK